MPHFLSFDQLGPETPGLPVLLSVPHSGRDYPDGVAKMVRLNRQQLLPLEDRYAELMIEKAVGQGAQALVARTPRLWIDLNRDEREFDGGMIEGTPERPPIVTMKVRGGLGLIPRKIARAGDVWHGKLSAVDMAERVAQHHRPYHAALAAALRATRAKFGIAILLDVHSMPPLRCGEGWEAPEIVLGDRFGRSTHSRFTARALAELEVQNLAVAVNSPYSGGHILDRHAEPRQGIHALQVEVDRRLYLDASLTSPGPGLARVQRIISALVGALAQEALESPLAIAAE